MSPHRSSRLAKLISGNLISAKRTFLWLAVTRLSAAGIDYANLVARLSENGELRRGDPQVEAAIRRIEDLGVSFDGHQYSYRGYRYDVLKDALRYALLEGEVRASGRNRQGVAGS